MWVVPASATAPSGDSASMRILLRGLGLAGEYACDILRGKGLGLGNDFGVDEMGGGGGGNGCAMLGTISGATTAPTRVLPLSVEEEDDACGGGSGCACGGGGGNGGVVDGPRRNVAGWGGGRDSGEGGGMTKEVGRSDAGTVEGITSVSKDASRTRFPAVVRRPGRESERREPEPDRFADAEARATFKGDLNTAFPLDLERVFRGEVRDGPGCATAGARFSGLLESKSRFLGLCSTRFEFDGRDGEGGLNTRTRKREERRTSGSELKLVILLSSWGSGVGPAQDSSFGGR